MSRGNSRQKACLGLGRSCGHRKRTGIGGTTGARGAGCARPGFGRAGRVLCSIRLELRPGRSVEAGPKRRQRGCGGSPGKQDPAGGLPSVCHAQGAHSKACGQGRRRRASGGRAGEPQAPGGGPGPRKVRFRGRVAVPDPGVHSGHRHAPEEVLHPVRILPDGDRRHHTRARGGKGSSETRQHHPFPRPAEHAGIDLPAPEGHRAGHADRSKI